MPLYLDYSATTPIHPDVLQEIFEVYKHNIGNAGSRTHFYGQKANQVVEIARGKIASLLRVDKSEIIFTSGATESNNIAILGIAKWGAKKGRRHIISTQIEHKAVLEPLAFLEKQGFEVDLVPVDGSCRIQVDDIVKRIRPDTLLVSVMHANNETGVIQPIIELGEVLQTTSTYFHVDAAQTFGKLVDELREAKYDFLSASGHKIYGPQGIGALIIKRRGRRRPPIEPITYGGGQEAGLRPGTLPVALVAGFGKAAEIALENHLLWDQKNRLIKDSIISQLKAIPYVVNGSEDHCLHHCLNVSFPGIDSEALMLALKDQISISNGSACTSSSYTPSHVLQAMGLASDIINSAIRISWGYGVEEIDLEPVTKIISNF